VAYKYLSSAMEDSTAAGGFLHTEYFVLVDKEGNLRSRTDDDGNMIGVYDGTDGQQVRDLIDDIKVLIAEYNLELKKNNKAEE
jgi:protein SCO1/2